MAVIMSSIRVSGQTNEFHSVKVGRADCDGATGDAMHNKQQERRKAAGLRER